MLLRPIISRLGRLGLQRRIMLYVTGGLIVVMAAYSAVSLQAISQSDNLVFRERLMVAGTVAQEIDSELSHLQGELNDMGKAVGTDLANNQPAKAQQAMQGLRQHWSAYDHFSSPCAIILTDPKGVAVWSDPPISELSSADFSNLPSFRAAIQSMQPSVADEISPGADGHGSLWMATPVLTSGRIEGVLLGQLNLSQVSQSFAPLLKMDKPGYSLELVDRQGMVLASQQPERQWKLSEHYVIIKDLLARQQAGTGTHQMPAGSSEPTHIVAFAPLSGVTWGVTVEEPQDLALTLPRALENRFLLFGMLVLLTGLVLAWVTTRSVVRPVNALIDETQHIAAGNLDHALDVTAEDEVGRLARSFDEMRVELKQSREEIARWNRELEARVGQRTRELSALVKSSHALAATLNLDALFEILIKETREVVPSAEGIAFFLFDNARELLVVRSTFGFDPAICQQLGFRIGEGIAGKVFEAQSPVRLGLAEQIQAAQSNLSSENSACFRRAIGERPVKSALGAPLVSKGARLGALVLYNLSREDAFTENEVTVLQAFANQATAAIENARLYASLQEKEAARAALLEQAIQAQEEERARVAREIHDELGQLLTRLSIDLKMCETQVAAEPEQAAQTLAATQTLVWQTIEQAHHLIVELRPTLLDELGLEAALREELATRLEPLGVTTRLEADGEPERLPASVETAVFRIVQEAISNIARHAHASHATLSLHVAGALQVRIEDDGVGIRSDWQSGSNGHRPLGLLGMQERAALIGGTLTIEPNVPQGTRVILSVPLGGDAPLEKKSE
jgi:signal transduction histidine kinase